MSKPITATAVLNDRHGKCSKRVTPAELGFTEPSADGSALCWVALPGPDIDPRYWRAPTTAPNGPTVAVAVLKALLGRAGALGVAPGPYLARAGLGPESLADVDGRVPAAIVRALWEELPRRAGRRRRAARRVRRPAERARARRSRARAAAARR